MLVNNHDMYQDLINSMLIGINITQNRLVIPGVIEKERNEMIHH